MATSPEKLLLGHTDQGGEVHLYARKLAEIGGYCRPLLDGTEREGEDTLWRDRRGRYYLESERRNEGYGGVFREDPEARHVRRVHRLSTTAAILWCIKHTVGSDAGMDLRWDAIRALGAVGCNGETAKQTPAEPEGAPPHGQAA